MIIGGEITGLNSNSAYKGAGIVTLTTGNNVIGTGAATVKFFRDIRSNYQLSLSEKYLTARGLKELVSDLRLTVNKLFTDSFQASNIGVATVFYGGEQILRYFGLAAENASFGDSAFGGKTLAAIESGALSSDTAIAGGAAIMIESRKLQADVRELTRPEYLDRLYQTSAVI